MRSTYSSGVASRPSPQAASRHRPNEAFYVFDKLLDEHLNSLGLVRNQFASFITSKYISGHTWLCQQLRGRLSKNTFASIDEMTEVLNNYFKKPEYTLKPDEPFSKLLTAFFDAYPGAYSNIQKSLYNGLAKLNLDELKAEEPGYLEQMDVLDYLERMRACGVAP